MLFLLFAMLTSLMAATPDQRFEQRQKEVKAFQHVGKQEATLGKWLLESRKTPIYREALETPANQRLNEKFQNPDVRAFTNTREEKKRDSSLSGKGVGVLVLEVDGVPSRPDCQLCRVIPGKDASHGEKVADVLLQMAPAVTLYGDSLGDNFYDEHTGTLNPNHMLNRKNIRVVNMSWGVAKQVDFNIMTILNIPKAETLSTRDKNDARIFHNQREKLFVIAAGNNIGSVEHDYLSFAIRQYAIENRTNLDQFIFVVNITPYGGIAEGSSTAGKLFEQDTISTLGTDLHVGNDIASGTSFSAPIVSGAAALILEKYPHFAPGDVKECLLNSATRRFFAPFKYSDDTITSRAQI